MAYDVHKNFGVSLIAVAPTPAASGTTFSVTAGTGVLFPAAPFNVVVWPAGANPTAANAEIVRITSKGTGDNWTGTRTTESSSARSIALGDQVANAITAKVFTDIEAAQALDAAAIVTLTALAGSGPTGRVPGGRLTLTTAVPVTTADVTGASAVTLYYTPYIHNVIALYSGTAWADFTFPELSIAIPSTTSQMYDVFVYDNAGTRTLELLAWTNDTTRATALVRQDGHICKSGALTRLYVGSVRTAGVSGQTEDSVSKRFVWNFFHRVRRMLMKADSTATWVYNTATIRQARATATNQTEIVIGVAEVLVSARYTAALGNDNAALQPMQIGIGLDSTTAYATNSQPMPIITGPTANEQATGTAHYEGYPAVGYHTLTMLEKGSGTGSTTWFGTATYPGVGTMLGWVEG